MKMLEKDEIIEKLSKKIELRDLEIKQNTKQIQEQNNY